MNTAFFRLLFCSLFFAFSISLQGFSQKIKIEKLLIENREQPIGIDNAQPLFTWIISSENRDLRQTSYELQVSSSEKHFSSNIIWESGKVNTDQSIKVPYQGPELSSNQSYYYRVKVGTNKGNSPWSGIAAWQMGLLKESDWKAEWIIPGYEEPDGLKPSPIFRKEIQIEKQVTSATAFITAHGLYEAQLNGQRIGDAYFTPGWTSYNKRLQYQAYDITDQLKTGKNTIGAILGSGWYRGEIGWGVNKYGNGIALLMQIEVKYSDGSSQTFGTDSSWKSGTGAIQSSSIYDGETIDARKAQKGWSTADFDDQSWPNAKTADFGYTNLIATYNEPIRKQETLPAVKLITTPKGEKVLDFGQNLVGFVALDITGEKGSKITLQHAEVLDKEGNFYTTNLRAADQENTYILSGEGQEHFEPHFTWQGFRFVKIIGMEGEIHPENFTAVVLNSDMAKTGTFTTSNDNLNKLQHNIQWGQKGNFLDVPTDCPQRDERLGWTGDAQVFFRTAAYNMRVDNFFSKWMQDLAADQRADGAVPHVIPNVLGEHDAGSAGWADVSTIIPWQMYLLYGNQSILEKQYPSMKAWVDYIQNNSHHQLWNTGAHFGDWLFYRPDDDNDGRSALTDKHLIAQCFFAHSTQLLINTAKVLGKQEDVQNYTQLLEQIKAAFLQEFVTPNGRMVSSSQTAYVLALQFDMLPEDLRTQAAQRLANNIKSYDYHLTTGFLGTPYLCHVLSRFGQQDLAFTLLMQPTYPSWLYPISQGATTIWERWDGQKPDGSFQTPGMNSFNHYAYGAIGDWMYRNLAGINSSETPGETGYKSIIIRPHWNNQLLSDKVKEKVQQDLDEVNAQLQTYYGTVASHWKKENHQVTLNLTIPANTTAMVYLPTDSLETITEGGAALEKVKSIHTITQENGQVKLEIGSGNYTFIIAEKQN
ncbi:glycoside hydrolase family 78 protein [Echinicola marina]|uniref:alpha-L-rhamnosidase n=1 Tax=Echinicola marina TaxID=2859768 RepID=UPI001CF64A4A|nr:alpha-L-rhamnosidase [Echinicola marina]UCS91780.1 glycoside hydrolase family 78 protein [Echinicola marina]